MIKLHGRPTLILHDERLPVLRRGVPGGAGYVDGKPVYREGLTFQIRCNVQPVSGKDMKLVPEGQRQTEQYMIRHMHPREEDPALSLGDLVLRLGLVYEVQASTDWGAHIEARIMRVDVGPAILRLFDVEGTERWSLAPDQRGDPHALEPADPCPR